MVSPPAPLKGGIDFLNSLYILDRMSFENTRHKGVPIEDIKFGQLYSFNVNPQAQPARYDDLHRWLVQWHDFFVDFRLNDIDLYLESSPTGRFHFHGIIKIYNLKQYIFMLIKLNENASYEVDTIKDLDVWMQYCTKQYTLMKKDMDMENVLTYPIIVRTMTEKIRNNSAKPKIIRTSFSKSPIKVINIDNLE